MSFNESDQASLSRRVALAAGAALATAPLLASTPATAKSSADHGAQRSSTPAFITTKDGTKIAYKDWGKGQPILFSHGWPLAGDAWDAQMLFFGQKGFRVIAHDRRGHGSSDQPWDGNTMDQYADDLAELIEKLDLTDLVLVGHSTGGGEVAHYIGRHGSKRVAKVVLVGAVPPLMLKTEANPEGTPLQVFDDIRKGTATNRAQFFKDLTIPFYGFNRPGAKVSEGLREQFWRLGMQGGIKGEYDCIHEFSEVDYTADLKKIDKPTLVIHGDDDQIVPIAASAAKTAKIVKDAQLKIYKGGAHGLAQVDPDTFNADLLAFIRS
ncbi:MAG: alpha/beta hydrolase [Bradyrhizobium sp.]|jgi:non-heme chloroperoxidase|uniref:Alpha/beta hydrolase n=3 Tax=Bradyrhizobium TaxID=374 RepID=A0ABS5G396_9BRAD|nr:MULTISPECIES: alpha/beta hydrolase [Bradyrhizobium]MBR1135749.1 alpha/beta hydrolase [Bradyrhizobium denitrificans]MDU1494292.1 alpha/beta hydrolase [Bradyrhizobium sp.]MDU1544450.1 alpha/beta hydrolase [Bradyrhizobium sp.]MDU1666081.1 alpha/beta hydrolase [Bradyrhizobium sp.]MDU1806380.1 alpha/beta hydrolase [Bradyrhizobium sp.]